MIGGGHGAFIGAVHRMAAALDGQMELVCGAFSSNPERSAASGATLLLPSERVYPDYATMLSSEAALPADQRMDAVAIVTPNKSHYAISVAAIEAGFHVICDKPATFTLAEAVQLRDLVAGSNRLYALTHNYTGYPMVKEARELVRTGQLGTIRKVVVEYPQGWLAEAIESGGQKQADWRTDPAQAGISCCMGDIGTHAENLAEYITGLQIESLCADLSTFVPGRRLDDDGNVLLRLSGGARGILYASQVSVGEENGLRIRVYGTKGGVEWVQLNPNTLIRHHLEGPSQILRTGANHAYLSEQALHYTRLPAGHPEGFIEAFANIYRSVARVIQAELAGQSPDPKDLDFPTIIDGVRGMAFIDCVVKSSQAEAKWTPFVVP
ncbi:MAG: gfo/Idh/MocA family oxidoreductase [Planctomycetota bacterium]|nr:MAG: gfo/Idh/MocA family oxidoreductase [Planctomycetota bacterium]